MRMPLLALLARGPAHGYELKRDFENHFGTVWGPVNIGQIYTTLARLERDGLVAATAVEQNDRPNKRVFELTGSGREALQIWLAEPAIRARVRDDFVIKLVLAGLAGLADPAALIEHQRTEYLQALRDLDALSLRLGERATTAERLILEGSALHLEADLKWLDAAEDTLAQGGAP